MEAQMQTGFHRKCFLLFLPNFSQKRNGSNILHKIHYISYQSIQQLNRLNICIRHCQEVNGPKNKCHASNFSFQGKCTYLYVKGYTIMHKYDELKDSEKQLGNS